MTTIAIIQARMTSTRLPGKVLADVAGEPLLAYMIGRLRRATLLDGIWVATTNNATDEKVADLCAELGIQAFRGDEADVLGRYAGTAQAAGAQTVVRLTADCPLLDPGIVDQAVAQFRAGGFDYLGNSIELSYPDGLDVEVFSRAALDRAAAEATLPFHREHVTPYMRTGVYDDVPTGDFKVGRMRAPADFSHLRWTVDTARDLAHVNALIGELEAGYGWLDVIAHLTRPRAPGHDRSVGVSLRPATAADADLLFDWVNSPGSIAAKLATSKPIARGEHDAWLRQTLSSPDAAIWIAAADGADVGQVRFNRRNDALEVDIFVAPAARGAGIGLAMLDEARLSAAARWPGLPLLARVRPDNWPSRRLFVRAGYGGMVVAADHLILRRELSAIEETAE